MILRTVTLPRAAVGHHGEVRNLAANARFVVAPAAIAIFLLAVVVLAWGAARGIDFAVGLLTDDAWEKDGPLVALFKAVDLFLVGTVLLILAAGLWELFVSPLELPAWLVIDTLDDLKAKLANTLVLVLAVKFTEKLVAGGEALDLLYTATAVTLVGALLVAYANLKAAKKS